MLIKQFQEIYGTFEKPLFKAKEVGDLLGIVNIREIINWVCEVIEEIRQIFYNNS